MQVLKNNKLEVTLHPKGAEIISIIGVQDQINYMWKRDPRQWASSAPILFPIVGKVLNDTYRVDDKEYHLTGHGFARHNEFTVVECTDTKVVYQLVSNDEIIQQYPFLFELNISYTLDGDTLSCQCLVNNKDHEDIYFQIGGHPAFSCPFLENESSNDYYLEFSEEETLNEKLLNPNTAAMTRDTRLFMNNEKRFFIRQEMFNRDAIVLKDIKSKTITLKSLNHSKTLAVHMENFDHVGLWAAKHVGDLIAIEPWVGHTDYVDFTGQLKDKEGVKKLGVNESFSCCFKIQITQ